MSSLLSPPHTDISPDVDASSATNVQKQQKTSTEPTTQQSGDNWLNKLKEKVKNIKFDKFGQNIKTGMSNIKKQISESHPWETIKAKYQKIPKQAVHYKSLFGYILSFLLILISSSNSAYYFSYQCQKPCKSLVVYFMNIALLFTSLLYHIGVIITLMMYVEEPGEYAGLGLVALFMVLFCLTFVINMGQAYKAAYKDPSEKNRKLLKNINLSLFIIGFLVSAILLVASAYQLYKLNYE